VRPWRDLSSRARDLAGLLELALEESDAEIEAEIRSDLAALEEDLENNKFKLLLGGPHDRRDAILSIHAGAGGTESQDWVEMLLRMYLRWADRRGYAHDILDTMPGDEAGVKSVTVSIRGEYAYGYLRSERGVHRLVRLSPFDAAHRRHTSFALVESSPTLKMTLT